MKGTLFDKYYDVDKKKSKGILYWLSVFMCVAMLIFAVVTFVYVDQYKKNSESVIPQFQEFLDNGEYSEALAMYRELHATVVSVDPDEEESVAHEISMMDEMELIVSTRVEDIQNRVRTTRATLTTTEIHFLNEMEELTGSLVSNYLTSLCEEFLLGTIEKPDIVFVFEQFIGLTNVSSTAEPLMRELDAIEFSRGSVQAAENEYVNEDYINAVLNYMDIVEETEGFVNDFASSRLTEIKDVMYEPMLYECERMLENFQYYSAEQLLSSLAIIFPEDTRINADLLTATSNTSPVSEYFGSIEVICVRQLIADTTVAFEENYLSINDELYITCSEFTSMLEELYANDYVLVDPEEMVDMSSDTFLISNPLIVPDGKRPLVIIIENLDYSVASTTHGTCNRLVINEQNQVCGEYINSEGQTVVSRSAEAIGILDAFIEQHPDFSYNGVKGIISICGYESVFGYVVSEDQLDDRNNALTANGMQNITLTSEEIVANQEAVIQICNVLRETGWSFASSTYGNINASDSDINIIVSDTEKWMTQIGSLLGEVHMIVYPNGNFINGTDPRAEYLKNLGFRIFFGIGSNPYYTFGSNYLYFDRSLINGSTLRNLDYSRLFDVDAIYDPSRVVPLGE